MSMKLIQGDCLEILKTLLDNSVDAIITDLPYGMTACKWDVVIPFEPMWAQVKRVIKDNGAIVLFGSEPFSSYLRLSNIKDYKYDWVWKKNKKTGFMQGKCKPLNDYENISIFGSFSLMAQKFNGCYNPVRALKLEGKSYSNKRRSDHITGNRKASKTKESYTNLPSRTILFNGENKTVHPTQKPVALMEYLIKTYTNEGETVLDFCMGSGTTGVACVQTGRHFIGIEKVGKYFEIATRRIENTDPLFQAGEAMTVESIKGRGGN